MHLNPRQIEAFRGVMLTGSMTVAAESLMITQPAVSRLIKELEGQLQFKLFTRDGNRLTPTQEATILFAEVDRLYAGIERIAKVAMDLRHTKAGSLRVAAMGALSLGCITTAIRRLSVAGPEINVSLDTLKSPLILDYVAGRHFDIGFAQAIGESPGVDFTALPPVEPVCIIPVSYPIAEKGSISPEDLEGLSFISLGKNSPLRDKLDRLFDERKVDRKTVLEFDLAASVIELVAAGLGVAVVDPFSAVAFNSDKFVMREFRPKLTFEVQAVTPSHQPNSRLSDEFLAIVVQMFKAMQDWRIGDPPPRF